MTTELAKTYAPKDIEPQILQKWNDRRAFHAEPVAGAAPYSIVIPPPNVTAALHMGHALNNTIQDILIRYHRMLGDNAVWLPGTDHAGIATQTVVEKRVLTEEGKKRTDFPRDVFVAKIQAWKDQYERRILDQLKAMACSCDWDRTRFTMDPVCARAVREAFFRLFQDGLIYRGKRLVNWDPVTQTALADDEVEMQEVDGFFYYMRYPLADGSGHVTVATTRPETMLGDTAVAVNPKDPRAAALRGKFVKLPIVNRLIPIIEDDYVVLSVEHGGDPGDAKALFASGFLKVTPAHDPNDYELGRKHKLPLINVMAPDASISDKHGWPADDFAKGDAFLKTLVGRQRHIARKMVVKWFEENGLFEGKKPYRHSVGHSYRSHAAIEPYLSDQWYVKVTDDRLAGAALRAMAVDQHSDAPSQSPGAATPGPSAAAPNVLPSNWQGRLRFHPARYAKTFQTWHENIRDWCISRQLWWGHQIPVWSKKGDHTTGFPSDAAMVVRCMEDITYICLREDDSALIARIESAGFTRDPDVLDTWFSSGLWPLSTLGWPNPAAFPREFPSADAALKKWNPGSVLCTAREIITLWVSRMVMMNLYFLDRLPFYDVFIHAMIQDGEGRKMSKSLGNGVDPLDIIHSHGSDAMRFTLAIMTTNTQDVRMPVIKDAATGRNTSDKFDIGRNFANKLWNAARFALANLETAVDAPPLTVVPIAQLSLSDRWILSRLTKTVREVDRALNQYEFSNYAQQLYDFIWRDLCDWYIEAVKPTVKSSPVQRQVLALCLDVALRLLHPVMPCITEKLWERLCEVAPWRLNPAIESLSLPASELLIHARWPQAGDRLIDEEAEAAFGLIQKLVGSIREVRTTYKVPPRQKVVCSAKAPPALAQQILTHRDLIEALANVQGGEIGPKAVKPADAAVAVIGEMELYVHGLVKAEAESDRLKKRLAEIQKNIATLESRLSNKGYIDRAPAHLVQQTRDQLTAAQREAEAVKKQLEAVS